MTRRCAPLVLAAALGGCVSLEEARVQPAAIASGQRTIVLVFPAPGPLVVELDSKAESAAKAVPGLALVVQEAQDERDLANSQDLQQYLPKWDAAAAVLGPALEKLPQTPHKGRWLDGAQAEFSTGTIKALNVSKNLIDWKRKYYDAAPKHGRDYGKMLELYDALIFELNVAPGVTTDGEGGATPTLWASAKLFKAQTMRQLWRKEESVEDPAAKAGLYDFKIEPKKLVAAWTALAPQLAEKVAAAYAQALSVPARDAGTGAGGSFGPGGAAVPGSLPAGQGGATAPPLPAQP